MAGGSVSDMAMAGDAPAATRRAWIVVGAIALTAAVAWMSGLHQKISLEAIIVHRDALKTLVADHAAMAVLAYLAAYIAVVALSIPGASLFTLAGGFVFGWAGGAALSAIAATLGAGLVFLAARSAFAESLRKRAGPSLKKISAGFHAAAFHYLLFLRLVPVFPFWLVNLAPALLGIRLRTFLVATFIGILPGTIAFSVAGAGLDSVIVAQMNANPDCVPGRNCMSGLDPAALVTTELLVAFALLGLLALVPVAVKAWRGAKHPT